MKKNYLIIPVLIGLFYWFSAPTAFGAVTYTRTPTGTDIVNMITGAVTVTNFSDFGFNADANYWKIIASKVGNTVGGASGCYPKSQLSINQPATVEVADYWAVYALGFKDSNCDVLATTPYIKILETSGNPATKKFSVSKRPGSYVEIPITYWGLYVMPIFKQLFTDFWKIIAIVAGAPLAFYMIQQVIAIFQDRSSKVKK